MIDFSLTQEQLAIQKTAKDFAEKELKPVAAEIDKLQDPKECWNWELYEKANKLGFNKILIPEEYGGLGLSMVDACIVVEELAVADAGFATTIMVHNAIVRHVVDGATEEQKQEFFGACCNDPEERYFMAIADTEHGVAGDLNPRAYGAGKQVAGKLDFNDFSNIEKVPMSKQKEMITTAKKDGDTWILNGMKRFITVGSRAKLYTVTAKCDPEASDMDGAVATFFVPAGTPGLSFGHIEDKLGHRLTENAEVILEDVRIPDKWKHDWRMNLAIRGMSLNVLTAAVAVGISRRAYEEAIAYAQTRYKGGALIAHHQAVQRMLIDISIKTKTSRLFTYYAAWQDDNAAGFDVIQNMAKVYTADACIENALDGMQVFGGYGYMKDFPMEKLYRDARLMSIYDGSNEILRHNLIMPGMIANDSA
jgi:acyl-CoA dehydrogenase